MAGRGITYSQAITWLKVTLPLVALALLSTMFLFARSVTPTSTIPFAKFELEQRARDQRISEPFLAGQTVTGHDIKVTASAAKPDPQDQKIVHVYDLRADIDTSSARTVMVSSETGEVDSTKLIANLAGSVQITASNGYAFKTEALALNLDQGTAETKSQITGDGPFGAFKAGGMKLSFDDTHPQGHFLFTNGVKLVYTP